MANVTNIDRLSHPDRNKVIEEAHAWVVLLDGGSQTEQDVAELHDWLGRSALHQSEFRRIAGLWDELDDIVPKLVFSDRQDPAAAVKGATDERLRGVFSPVRLGFATVGLAAALFAAYSLLGPGKEIEAPDIGAYQAQYSSEIGEFREIALPDGSEIGLNTNSRAEVDYKQEARFVRLLEGQAHFDVSHNPDKPFVVYANDIAVRAVGTAFAVYIREDGSVEVTVTDGQVELSSLSENNAGSGPSIAQLEDAEILGTFVKGQQTVTKETIEHIAMLEPPEMEKRLSWRDRMLVFEEDRLEDVVSEVSRYTDVRIVFEDSSLRDMRVGGYFPAGETDALLSTLAGSFDIRIKRLADDLILLSQR